MEVALKHQGGWRLVGQSPYGRVVLDNQPGKDGEEFFRPGEMLLMGLASCLLATLLHYGRGMGLPVEGFQVGAKDTRVGEPERVVAITFTVSFSGPVDPEERDELFLLAKEQCKLLQVLGPQVSVTLEEGAPPVLGCDDGSCCLPAGEGADK